MLRAQRQRNRRGTSLIEVLAGAMFLIPIALFFIDVASLSLVQQLNDHLAKDAARAAANQLDVSHAVQAAQNTVKMCATSPLVANVQVQVVSYDADSVKTQATMDVRVPAPFPWFSGKKLVAQSWQPTVATPAAL